MTDPDELRLALTQFTGTETWFRHPFGGGTTFTEGVKFFAENAGNGAFWLLDIFMTELVALQRKEGFLGIKLTVSPDSKATITADDGNDRILWGHEVVLTDCPVGEWTFFFTDDVLLLPSEY